MPVVGSRITIDLHVTEDADLESLQALVRQSERVHPDFARTVRRAVEENARGPLEEAGIDGYDLSVDIGLVTERQPGAPRERVAITLDLEGEDSVVAAVDDAIDAPERADIADAVEANVLSYLAENGLSDGAELIISVTPIQFR
ncbi:MAG: hypothetical protein BRD25_05655 [Bacteroidetes bacterium QH_1_61_8]|jgi:hypothetical protein|nr:MAG: hypothetical protein BRD25_05655 [Bacteroidetes bacterium QH_1_61_8]